MFWVAALAVFAAAYLLVDTWADTAVVRVVGLAVLPATAAALVLVWIGDSERLRSAAVSSLRSLTGLQSVGEVVPTCTRWGPGAMWALQIPVLILLLGAVVADVVPAAAGVVGVPVGAVAALGGGVVSGVTRDAEPLQFGLRLLAGALGCLVIAALVLRLLHGLYTTVMC